MLSCLSARCVDSLLGCLWDSYCVTRDFDTRPGLKFLLQKVAHANTAANLYKLTAVSLTVYMHALLEICAHQDGLCIDNIKDMLASDPPHACPCAHIDAHVHTFVHMLKVRASPVIGRQCFSGKNFAILQLLLNISSYWYPFQLLIELR